MAELSIAIQMATTVSSLVNGGKRVTPHFGISIEDGEGTVLEQFQYEEKKGIVSEKTSETMRMLLKSVVEEGSGRNGAILEEMWTEDPADGKDRTGRMRAMAPCGSVWLEIHRIAIFAVPFLDETIQLFTEGRSGQISDVWLDMAGALTGTLLYLAAGQIYLRIKKNENG